MIALSNPIILNSDGSIKILDPDKELKISATLYRKYILMGQWIDRWSHFIGCRWEASEHSDFRDSIILQEITDIPFGNQIIKIDTTQKFRYIRFVTPVEDSSKRYQVPNLSEISLFSKITKRNTIKVNAVITAEGHRIDNPMRTVNLLSDDKYLTGTYWRYPYTITIDFGTIEHALSEIHYYPVTDVNFIQDPRYLNAYANYFCKFIDAYNEQGIPISMVMFQNEAWSYTNYPGCAWTAEGIIRFNTEYLAPA